MRASGLQWVFLLGAASTACTDRAQSAASSATTTTITISDKVECSTCSIVVETLAVLPHPDDTLSLLSYLPPARDSRGRYYVVDGTTQKEVHVLDSAGRRINTFGKPGRGPGEFSGIGDVEIGLFDSVYVFDRNRVLVFSPSYAYVREFQQPMGNSGRPGAVVTLVDGRFLIPSGPNRFVILSALGTLDSVSALHQAQRAEMMASSGRGSAANSVQVGIELADADTTRCMQCGDRFYEEALERGTIWSGSMHQYVVEQHDLSGKLRRRIVREASWFPPWPAESNGGHEQAIDNAFMLREMKKTRLIGAYESSDRVVWTQSTMQNPANPVPAGTDFEKLMMSDADEALDKHFVTVVEAIDPVQQRLLASRHMPGMVRSIGAGLVLQMLPNAAGERVFNVLRLRLDR